MLHFYNCELQIRPKHSKIKKIKKVKKVKKISFSDFYCLINAKFWNTIKKNIYKKVTFTHFYNCELQIRPKHSKIKKKSKK